MATMTESMNTTITPNMKKLILLVFWGISKQLSSGASVYLYGAGVLCCVIVLVGDGIGSGCRVAVSGGGTVFEIGTSFLLNARVGTVGLLSELRGNKVISFSLKSISGLMEKLRNPLDQPRSEVSHMLSCKSNKNCSLVIVLNACM